MACCNHGFGFNLSWVFKKRTFIFHLSVKRGYNALFSSARVSFLVELAFKNSQFDKMGCRFLGKGVFIFLNCCFFRKKFCLKFFFFGIFSPYPIFQISKVFSNLFFILFIFFFKHFLKSWLKSFFCLFLIKNVSSLSLPPPSTPFAKPPKSGFLKN